MKANLNEPKRKVTVFAPATVANVAVGFDLLGFAFGALGDRVTVERVNEFSPKIPVRITGITGIAMDLPLQPELNTATVGLIKLWKDLHLDFGFDVTLDKGIPKSSGLGGSAASAVAAIVAANELLDHPLSKIELLNYALEGEAVASGGRHADNLAPALWGGLQFVQSMTPLRVISIPIPDGIECVIIHPAAVLETKEARKVLSASVSLAGHIQQSALLAGFISGCYQNDLELIRHSLADVLIEPQRAHLIRGLSEAKAAALQAGALGCSISGAGPTLFAWVRARGGTQSESVRDAMIEQFTALGIATQSWIGPISNTGAEVIA